MSPYLLDTNHASGLFLNQIAPTRLQNLELPLLSVPVVSELWFMIFKSQRVQENRAKLERFLSQFSILPYDGAAAIEYGRIRGELSRKGKLIPQIDNQIAAIARIHQLTVLTADGHFLHVEQLKTENWLA